MTTPDEGADKKIELLPESIPQIVDILVRECPLGSEDSHLIAKPYLTYGCATNAGIDRIVSVIKDEMGLDYDAIIDNEHEIIPAYMAAIYYRPEATAFGAYRAQTATEKFYKLIDRLPETAADALSGAFGEAEAAVEDASSPDEIRPITDALRSRFAEALPGEENGMFREAIVFQFETAAKNWLGGPNEEALQKIEDTLELRFGVKYGANLKRNACSLGMLLGLLKFQLETYFTRSGVLITLDQREFERIQAKMTELKEANEAAAEEQGIELG
jgi:hypothetical protein